MTRSRFPWVESGQVPLETGALQGCLQSGEIAPALGVNRNMQRCMYLFNFSNTGASLYFNLLKKETPMTLPTSIVQRFTAGLLPTVYLAALLLTGCGTAPDSGEKTSASDAHAESHGHHDHDHPTEGPHHGELVELGNGEYHGEIVHEMNGWVTVYILDRLAENTVPIEAAEVVINLSHNGKSEQFKLPASPNVGDPLGKSSRFAFEEGSLGEALDAEGNAAKLVVTINGKQYTGNIDHYHGGNPGHQH